MDLVERLARIVEIADNVVLWLKSGSPGMYLLVLIGCVLLVAYLSTHD